MCKVGRDTARAKHKARRIEAGERRAALYRAKRC